MSQDSSATQAGLNNAPPAQSSLLLKNYADVLNLSSSIQARLCDLFEREYGAQVWKQTSASENVGGLSIPVLVIHDKDDSVVPWEEGKLIAQVWPGAKLLTTESLGHRQILRNRAVVDGSVEFLRS